MSDVPPEESRFRPLTESASSATAQPSPPPPVGDSLASRLRDLVAHPARLMDRVAARPRWWVPGLIIFVVLTGFAWFTSPISGPEQMELMRDSKLASMVPEEQWQAQYDEAMNPGPATRFAQALGAGFVGWLMVLAFGFILGFFARMSGGKGTFRQALGITSWAALIPFVLGTIVKLPLVLATESVYRVNIGLAALMPGAEPSSAVFKILMTYGDFLTWWGLAVLVIGFARVFALPRNGAIVTVVLPWALLNLVPLGLSLLFM